MNKQVKLSATERAQLIEDSIGIVEVDSAMLDMVSGGAFQFETTFWDSCIVYVPGRPTNMCA